MEKLSPTVSRSSIDGKTSLKCILTVNERYVGWRDRCSFIIGQSKTQGYFEDVIAVIIANPRCDDVLTVDLCQDNAIENVSIHAMHYYNSTIEKGDFTEVFIDVSLEFTVQNTLYDKGISVYGE